MMLWCNSIVRRRWIPSLSIHLTTIQRAIISRYVTIPSPYLFNNPRKWSAYGDRRIFLRYIFRLIQICGKCDSISIYKCFSVMKDHQVVVGDIRIIPQDSIDSVWVQLATDEGKWGWIHETELLPSVVPVDPISQSIMFFSDTHIIITLIILTIIGISYVSRTIYRSNAPMVHVRDIPSFYPTLLCLIVASSASLYASVQMFAPETWRHFYYHPSLNPFKLPFILSIFITSVWAMVVIALAADRKSVV